MTDEAFWTRLLALVEQLDEQSYYRLLGVGTDADAAAVRASFYRRAARLHPDRFARERDGRRRHAVNLYFARLREACGVLVDADRRARYDAGLARGHRRLRDDVVERKEAARPQHPNARRFFELGMERLRAGDVPAARLQLQMAAQIEPDSPAIREALARCPGAAGANAAAPTMSTAEPAAAGRPGTPAPSTPAAAELPGPPAPPAPTAPAGPRAPAPPAVGTPEPTSAPRAIASAFAALVRASPIADVAGIDFGTSYTSISVGIGDRLRVVPDAYGRSLHPSVVHVGDDGRPLCGWSARERLVSSPRQTISSPKRLLGRQHDDPLIAGQLQSAPFTTHAGPDGSVVVELGEQAFALPQLCGEIISHVRAMAERQLRRPIDRAVLTVPVTFGAVERAALGRAAQLAGVDVVALLEEPVAAALSYGFGQGKSEIVAVYDFGGGTFDFTVLDLAGYSFEVLVRAGDAWLGGDDFDQRLAGAIADAVWRKTGVELRQRVVEWQRLLFACERAKRQLSEREQTRVVVDNLLERPQPINLRQPLDRAVMASLCAPLVQQSIEICRAALGEAGLDPEDIGQVVVSGGVSHIPFVRRAVSQLFGREVRVLVNPDEAICAGAGLRAAQLSQFPVAGVG